ncbi:MAG TPA: hypothetical protein VF765_37090 [Polyangiaceae bacterium]
MSFETAAQAPRSAHEVVSARDVVAYTSVDDDGHSLRSQSPTSVTDACSDQVNPAAARLCQDSKDVSTAYTLALIG